MTGQDKLVVDISGAGDLVGYRSSIDDLPSCSLHIGPQHLNRVGLLHGGFVSMLLDNGCGVAIRKELGDIEASIVTVTLSVTFVAGASEGLVTAVGRVVGGGRSLKFAEAELRDQDGQLLATGSATFRVLRKG